MDRLSALLFSYCIASNRRITEAILSCSVIITQYSCKSLMCSLNLVTC
uniref:Uncharacterized protein n=1 Tax=Rhizophora mucronata TaxID=61149 RepID=A0A2P2N4E9_RHIMU